MQIAPLRVLPSVVLVALAACSPKAASDDTDARQPDMAATSEAPAASAAPASEPTAADFLGYELTMDKMRKWAAVSKGFSTFSGSSADSAAMMTVKIGTDPIAESERKIESIGPMKRIFETAGLTPREYHMITGAYGMSQLPTSRNAEFVKANKAELDKLMAGLR